MGAAESAMLASTGYTPDVIDGLDGTPDDVIGAAQRYDRTQRDADQAIVDQAGASGVWTDESRAAASPLRDSDTIGNSANSAEARRLAGERLDDFDKSRLVGPLPADTVLGGDARTRAQARLQLQKTLESPEFDPNKSPLTPDQVTRLLDQFEAEARTTVLADFKAKLEQGGVSPIAAEQAVNAVQNGASPSQLVRDVGAGLATYGGALGAGAQAHGGALPTGTHWGEAPAWSKADAAVLKGFGAKLGGAGIALDFVLTGSDIAHGAPVLPAVEKLGGRTIGGLAGGWAAGAFWGSFIGPEGTLVVGLLGAVVGGIGGEKAVNWALGK